MVTITKRENDWLLTTEQIIHRPLDEVFDFFADAGNLEEITPPWLHFGIITPPPIEMRVGALIDYKLRMRMMPIRWRTEISAWDPPTMFVDQQLKGPYRKWIHTHTFTAVDGGTRVCDHVEYDVPGGPLVNWLLVERDLIRIFEYRHDALERIFHAKGIAASGLSPV